MSTNGACQCCSNLNGGELFNENINNYFIFNFGQSSIYNKTLPGEATTNNIQQNAITKQLVPPIVIGKKSILTRPKFPNNTILAELSAGHRPLTWLWPAKFEAKAIPEPLLRANISLTVEEYSDILSILTNDLRFNIHLALYKRIFLLWTTLTLLGLIVLILSNLEAVIFYGSMAVWLTVQALAFFACRLVRSELNFMLEKAIAQVNSFLLGHNLMLGSLDRGGFVLTNAVIPIIYFDTSQCREHIESIIERDCKATDEMNTILDYSRFDLSYPAPKQLNIIERSRLAKKIILRYSQRWILMFDKKKLSFTSQMNARHLSTGKCFCQYIEDHFALKKHSSSGSNNKQSFHLKEAPPAINNSCQPSVSVLNNTQTNFQQAPNSDDCNISIVDKRSPYIIKYKRQDNGLRKHIARQQQKHGSMVQQPTSYNTISSNRGNINLDISVS